MNLPSRGGGTTIKTDKKGRWALGGIAAGEWEVDLSAEGYALKKLTINLPSEAARIAPVEVKLDKAAPAGPPPEVREALEKGDDAFKAGRFAEAREHYEKLLALRPELAGTLYSQIAFAYSREGNYAKAVEYLDKLVQSDPTNVNLKLLAAQEALRAGMLDKGLELLKGIDDSSIKNPEVFYNVAALLLNAQKPQEAIGYLTKAVTVDPAYVDGYFQRGLAYLGQGKTGDGEEGAGADQVAGASARRRFTSACVGTASPPSAVNVPGPRSSTTMRRSRPRVARMAPDPRLSRRTPSASSSGTAGQPAPPRTLSGPPSARTSVAIVSRSVTPGTNRQSAPASRYRLSRRAAWPMRVSGAPMRFRNTSVRALMTMGTPAATAASRAARTRSTWSWSSKSEPLPSAGASSRFMPTAPAARTARAVSAADSGVRP